MWHVFNTLVDTFTAFRDGESEDYAAEPWKEIMHNDLCLTNIFVMSPLRHDGLHDHLEKSRPTPEKKLSIQGKVVHRATRNEVRRYLLHGVKSP
jgi:predicted transcriptional regulator